MYNVPTMEGQREERMLEARAQRAFGREQLCWHISPWRGRLRSTWCRPPDRGRAQWPHLRAHTEGGRCAQFPLANGRRGGGGGAVQDDPDGEGDDSGAEIQANKAADKTTAKRKAETDAGTSTGSHPCEKGGTIRRAATAQQ